MSTVVALPTENTSALDMRPILHGYAITKGQQIRPKVPRCYGDPQRSRRLAR
ncbi:hypothetical protein AB0H34_17635 [Saccharopolyspora shandongensis]|uniref:hypothetical protein n=1 Tax=Saccharopolyspora shandongensis TaxID=418495 RepID=UPI0033EE1DFD